MSFIEQQGGPRCPVPFPERLPGAREAAQAALRWFECLDEQRQARAEEEYSRFRYHHSPVYPDFGIDEVPDPYYGGESGFDRVFDMIEAASRGLLDEIDAALRR